MKEYEIFWNYCISVYFKEKINIYVVVGFLVIFLKSGKNKLEYNCTKTDSGILVVILPRRWIKIN